MLYYNDRDSIKGSFINKKVKVKMGEGCSKIVVYGRPIIPFQGLTNSSFFIDILHYLIGLSLAPAQKKT